MYPKWIKPILDFLFSLALVVVLSPFFFLIGLALIISLGGNPFFLQKRPGRNAEIFTIIKFRTMKNKRDKNGDLLPDKDRLSTFGLVLRRLSLDELPQLLNVLKGDMSFVGPRPLLPEYLPLYNDFQRQRHMVKPGITGYAQVNGRNAISWEKKFELDVYYAKNLNFTLDLSILLKTVKKVILREGISNAGSTTTTRFKGN